ncbi:MAG: ABC transporter substrate-binding protein [Candidatus Hodarchaeota archaeon]
MIKKNVKQLIILCILLGSMVFVISNETGKIDAETSALPDIIKIGYLAPLTGSLGSFGSGMLEGAELAEWVVNTKWGGISRNGKTQAMIDIIVKDTETDPAKVSVIVNDLITIEGCEVIIGAAASSCTLAADGVTDPNEVVLISYASTSPAISTDAGDYTYRVVPMDKLQGDALAALAYEKEFRHAAMIYLDNSYGLGFATVFKQTFIALGGTVELNLPYIETKTSFDMELTAIKTAADAGTIDVIMDVSYSDDGAIIFIEAALAGITTPWVCAEGVADEAIFDVATGVGEAITGMMGTKPFLYTNTPEYQEFLGYFKEFYGATETPGIYCDYSYDAVMLAVEAISAADVYNGSAIKAALDTVNVGWIGATGDKTFDILGDVGGSYILWEVTEDPTGTCWEFTQFGMWTSAKGVDITVTDPIFTGTCPGMPTPPPTTTSPPTPTPPSTTTDTTDITESSITSEKSTDPPPPVVISSWEVYIGITALVLFVLLRRR